MENTPPGLNRQGLLQAVDVGDVVQIDGGPQAVGQGKLLRRGVIGGKHDLFSLKAAALGHHQLGQGGAVHAAPLLPQELENGGRRGSFDGKILPKPGIPGKGRLQPAGVFPDAPLVIEMKRGRILRSNVLELLLGDKRLLHCGLT